MSNTSYNATLRPYFNEQVNRLSTALEFNACCKFRHIRPQLEQATEALFQLDTNRRFGFSKPKIGGLKIEGDTLGNTQTDKFVRSLLYFANKYSARIAKIELNKKTHPFTFSATFDEAVKDLDEAMKESTCCKYNSSAFDVREKLMQSLNNLSDDEPEGTRGEYTDLQIQNSLPAKGYETDFALNLIKVANQNAADLCHPEFGEP
jgi:hypothetical protein